MSKELEILTFADVCVKGWLQQDKERLEDWRKDREVLYSALEEKEKLEKAITIIKKYLNINEFLKPFRYMREIEPHVILGKDNLITQEEYDLLREVFGKCQITK